MRYDWRGSLLIVLNFDQKPLGRRRRGRKLLNLLVKDESRTDAGGLIECARGIRLSMVTASVI